MIFLVVVGHLVPGITAQVIFLFHMPFFFLISGYFHKRTDSYFSYFNKKMLSLIVPYTSYVLLFSVPFLSKYIYQLVVYGDQQMINKILEFVAFKVYGGELMKGTFGVFWFVTCLFFTQQLFNWVVNHFDSRWKILSVSLVLYVVAMLNQIFLYHAIFPWASNVVLCSFLFYTIGYLFGDEIFNNTNEISLLLSFVTLGMAVLLLLKGYKIGFNMKFSYYGWFIVSPLVAIALTRITMALSHTIVKVPFVESVFVFAGVASITIMFTHQFFHMLLRSFSTNNPWLASVCIFALCSICHLCILRVRLLKALLLGDIQELGSFFNQFSARLVPKYYVKR